MSFGQPWSAQIPTPRQGLKIKSGWTPQVVGQPLVYVEIKRKSKQARNILGQPLVCIESKTQVVIQNFHKFGSLWPLLSFGLYIIHHIGNDFRFNKVMGLMSLGNFGLDIIKYLGSDLEVYPFGCLMFLIKRLSMKYPTPRQ